MEYFLLSICLALVLALMILFVSFCTAAILKFIGRILNHLLNFVFYD